jgi:hypothetical protein
MWLTRTCLATALAIGDAAMAAPGPVPPCAGPAEPGHAALGSPPRVQVWEAGDLPAPWSPPACLSWPTAAEPVLVAAAGRLRAPGGSDGLLGRVARISDLPKIRFWSVTRESWLPMFESAVAVTGADGQTPRPDFTASELVHGAVRYLLADQNDPLGAIVQRLTVRERSADRLVLELENVSGGTLALVEVLPVGGARTLLHMEREAGEVWTFYTLISVTDQAPDMLAPPRASWINRAVALYRWFAGIPTDREPPAAR